MEKNKLSKLDKKAISVSMIGLGILIIILYNGINKILLNEMNVIQIILMGLEIILLII